MNFSNFEANHLTLDAISAIVACIELYQTKVKRIIFENCSIDPEKAKAFRLILTNPVKNIMVANFDKNQLGD